MTCVMTNVKGVPWQLMNYPFCIWSFSLYDSGWMDGWKEGRKEGWMGAFIHLIPTCTPKLKGGITHHA
jgi:hypothetical protein